LDSSITILFRPAGSSDLIFVKSAG